MQGRTGDPAPPAPLSSRVSLIQCSNFSIILNNYCNAATFACRPHLFPLHTAGSPRRSVNRVILQRIPKHTPLIQEYSNINSYLAGIKIGYAIASAGARAPDIHQLCASAPANALLRRNTTCLQSLTVRFVRTASVNAHIRARKLASRS